MQQPLFVRDWPIQDAKAGVCIVHGLAEHSGRYAHVAGALNRAGYSAHGVDLRGHGNSPGFPGQMGDLETNIRDVVGFCNQVSALYDTTFLLAHSMGTLLALPAVAEMAEGTIDGLILSGTAIVPGEAILEALASGKGIDPELVSRDPQVVEAYVNDPLVFHDRVPGEVMNLAAEATERARSSIQYIWVPLLLLHGTEDKLCDIQGAHNVYVNCNVRDRNMSGYPGLYHEVLNEPERDQVIGDLIDWLDEHTGD